MAFFVLALPGALLLLGLVGLVACRPEHVFSYRPVAVAGAGFAALAVLGVALVVGRVGPIDRALIEPAAGWAIGVGVYVDALSALMLVLTATLGFVVCRYSLRYLDGAAGQARFLAWTLLTLAAVLCQLCVSNLAAFVVCWCTVSAGLHQLLTFFPERPAAVRAARKKFVISRIGDLCLLGAVVLAWKAYGTLEIPALLQAALSGGGGGEAQAMALLLVLGAMTKSAQLPFHSWLPETMETPTPVSALMHAGIINAGGYLIVRLSPLVARSPLALNLLLVNGALTAALGSVVMLTQTDVKRCLAYSTVSQMGFMMMQCGFGAFSAAVLHIIAHGLYKAHAFLAAGGAACWSPKPPDMCPRRAALCGLATLALSAMTVAAGAAAVGVHLLTKPGGLVIATFMIAGVSPLVFRALGDGRLGLSQRAILTGLGVILAAGYLASWKALDGMLVPCVAQPQLLVIPSAIDRGLAAIVAAATVAALFVGWAGHGLADCSVGRRAYVLALNGFHVAELLRLPFASRGRRPMLSAQRAA